MNPAPSGIFVKLRLPTGNTAIYECQPQHISNPDHIRQYGRHLFTKFDDQWHPMAFGMASGPLHSQRDQEKIQTLDDMMIDFDLSGNLAWGIQVKHTRLDPNTETPVTEWRWMQAAGLDPYRFESIEAASRAMQIKYPDHASGQDVRIASMTPQTFETVDIVAPAISRQRKLTP